MTEVQSMILNLSFPDSLDEVYDIMESSGEFDIEVIARDAAEYEWTIAKWAKPGDIVFFMHSRTSIQRIRRLKKELRDNTDCWKREGKYEVLRTALNRAEELYDCYGGKIFALAKIDSQPTNYGEEDNGFTPHWKSRIYASVCDAYLLSNPIDLAEFKSFVILSTGGTITPVYGAEFEKLRDLVLSKNDGPLYLKQCISMPIPFMKMNENNWLDVASKYRMSFIYEKQFRAFYVDYFLRIFSDRKRFYEECACEKSGQPTSFVDNVIVFSKQYLPVEVKLSVKAERDLERQVRKYCYLDKLYLDKKKGKLAVDYPIVNNKVFVIDTFSTYLYHYDEDYLEEITNLNQIKDNKDIIAVRELVMAKM